MILRTLALTSTIAFAAGVANAQNDDFTIYDADASGGLSYEEVKSINPDVSEQDFLAYDTDGSGELSVEEFTVWTSGGSAEEDMSEGDQ